MGCDEISLAGCPLGQPLQMRHTAPENFIACMRYRRGRPEGRTAATCVNSRCHDRCSRLIKVCHDTRMGCGRTSQRAAQGSLYRGAGRQRRSERLKVAPYAQGRWPYIFLLSVTALFPSPDCDFVGDVPEDILEGVPLCAEGFPKRRY